VDEASGEPVRDRGFKARKREDHALTLIDRLKESLGDLAEVRRILRELGRYYDPVLGGAIMEVGHQRLIVEALEAGRLAEALALVAERYDLYLKIGLIWATEGVWAGTADARRYCLSVRVRDDPLSREQDRRRSRIRAGRSRLQGGLRGRRLDDAGVFQGVLDACRMGPRDANWG